MQVSIEEIVGRFTNDGFEIIDKMGLIEITPVENQILVVYSFFVFDFRQQIV